jgi:hypothetical protein
VAGFLSRGGGVPWVLLAAFLPVSVLVFAGRRGQLGQRAPRRAGAGALTGRAARRPSARREFAAIR